MPPALQFWSGRRSILRQRQDRLGCCKFASFRCTKGRKLTLAAPTFELQPAACGPRFPLASAADQSSFKQSGGTTLTTVFCRKSVSILIALGIKNIHLGPNIPAFISPNGLQEPRRNPSDGLRSGQCSDPRLRLGAKERRKRFSEALQPLHQSAERRSKANDRRRAAPKTAPKRFLFRARHRPPQLRAKPQHDPQPLRPIRPPELPQPHRPSLLA